MELPTPKTNQFAMVQLLPLEMQEHALFPV